MWSEVRGVCDTEVVWSRVWSVECGVRSEKLVQQHQDKELFKQFQESMLQVCFFS